MSLRRRLRNLWQRYLVWRKGEGVRPPKAPERVISKLAIDDEDIASTVTANRGNGWVR